MGPQTKQNWKALETAAGKAAAGKALSRIDKIEAKYRTLANGIINAVNEITHAYAQDLYGKNNVNDKYRYVVDLIIDRIEQELLQSNSDKTALGVLKTAIIDSITANGVLSDTAKTYFDAKFLALSQPDGENSVAKAVVEKLKTELSELFEDGDATPDESPTFKNKAVDSLEDETVDDYKDSTIANNFSVLNSYIEDQFAEINKKIGGIGLGVVGGAILGGIKKISGAVGKLGANVFKFTVGAGKAIGSVAKTIGGGVLSGILGSVKFIGNGIKGISRGIGSLGKKIGGAIASPFKKMGSFFSKLNPFKRSKKEEKAEAAKAKMTEIMAKVIDKIWKLIKPFVKTVLGLIKKFVILPVAMIALKVMLIIAALILIGYVVYKVIQFLKEKIQEAWDYITSGQMWEDIVSFLKSCWDWLVDFGAWLGGILLDVVVWPFKMLFYEIPLWIWDKLCQFGAWLYDNYINPYIVAPFKKYIWEPVQKLWNDKIYPKLKPFVESMQNLIAKIKKAFSAWDTNKSIWENLKNIAGIIRQSIADWWETSPFKRAYDTYIAPVVQSISDLIGRIRDVWNKFNWDENKSFLENMMAFWTNVKTAIIEWWNNSTIKTYWDKLVNFLSDLIKPVVDWYNQSALKQWIDKIADFGKAVKDAVISWWRETPLAKTIDEIKSKGFGEWFKGQMGIFMQRVNTIKNQLANISFNIPSIGFGDDISWRKPSSWFKFGWKELHPFGFLASKPTEGAIKVETAKAGADDVNEDSKDAMADVARQQVGNMAQPAAQRDAAMQQNQDNLSKEAKLYSAQAAQEKANSDNAVRENLSMTQSTLDYIKIMHEDLRRSNAAAAENAASGAAAGAAAGAYGGRNNGNSLIMGDNN